MTKNYLGELMAERMAQTGYGTPVEVPAETAETKKTKAAEKQARYRNNKNAVQKQNMERYLQQESKRATRPQIDQNGTLYLSITLTVITFIASAALVANGTIAVAAFMGLAFDWLAWLVFGALEVAILTFLLFYLMIGSRSEEQGGGERAARPWFALVVAFSGIVIIANGFHAIEYWNFDWSEPRLYVGAVLAMIVPLSYVLVSKGLSTVVFAKPIKM
jgi:hypothetical protein